MATSILPEPITTTASSGAGTGEGGKGKLSQDLSSLREFCHKENIIKTHIHLVIISGMPTKPGRLYLKTNFVFNAGSCFFPPFIIYCTLHIVKALYGIYFINLGIPSGAF